MERVVYILGAGFSRPFGLPLISDFFDKAKAYYRDKNSPHFKIVRQYAEKFALPGAYYNNDQHNIEEILSYVDMHYGLTRRKILRNAYETVIKEVITSCTQSIPESIGHSHPIEGMFPLVSALIREYAVFVGSLLHASVAVIEEPHLVDHPRLRYRYGPGRVIQKEDFKAEYAVITLNYDMILENIAGRFALASQPGFVKDYHKHVEFHRSFSKLHGSVDGVIIPPTWTKNFHNDSIRNAWQLAERALSRATQIRIIGYSLPVGDSYIKYLLQAAVGKGHEIARFDVLCLDDEHQTVEQRYRAFIKKSLKFQARRVEEYLNTLRPREENNCFIFSTLEEQHHRMFP